MRGSERQQIRRAITLLMEDRFTEGLGILAKLAGLEYPPHRAIKGATSVPVTDLPHRDASFKAPRR